MADGKAKSVAGLKVGDRIKTNLQKSPQYRTIHCDGAYGGISPRGYISVTFYNERAVIPRILSREVLNIDEAGSASLGPDQIEESLEGIMRQLEATIVMDINASRDFYTWFGDKVADLEKAVGLPEDERVGKKKDAPA